MLPLICITGPTATGKTRLAAAVAGHLSAAVISADSRQVYRRMDIGTGKDLSEYTFQGRQIPYYMIDIRDAGEEYNVFEYRRDFDRIYRQLQKEGKNAVLCGGSGMYVESVLENYTLEEVPWNQDLRDTLANKDMEELTEILKSYIHLHNNSDTETRERLLRAIEIQEFYRKNQLQRQNIRPNHLIFKMSYPREILRERITQRLHARLKEGMVEEVETLMKDGLTKEQLTYYGLEYKFITLYLTGELSYEDMVLRLNTAIHQFAKRQETWFRHMEKKGFILHPIDGCLDFDRKLEAVMRILQQYAEKEGLNFPR